MPQNRENTAVSRRPVSLYARDARRGERLPSYTEPSSGGRRGLIADSVELDREPRPIMLCCRKALKVLLVLLLGAGSSCTELDPAPHPSAVVVQGRARFTVLSPHVIRMEHSSDSASGGSGSQPLGLSVAFDDRATLAIVNRRMNVPPFKVQRDGSGPTTLTITTTGLKLTYIDRSSAAVPAAAPPLTQPRETSERCAAGMHVQNHSDAILPIPLASGTSELNVTTMQACCTACANATGCNAWVYALGSFPGGNVDGGTNCFLMASIGGTVPTNPGQGTDRVVASYLTAPPSFTADNLKVEVLSKATKTAAPAVWRFGDEDTQNLNGTVHSMDCCECGPLSCLAVPLHLIPSIQYTALSVERPGAARRSQLLSLQ